MPDRMGDTAANLKVALADRYALRREIGRGGMATVYLADDLRHGRPVALKVLHPEVSGSLGATRFLREIQVVAHLNHPHILPLLDSGRVDDRLFYVMPFVDGESLRDRLDRAGPIPLEEAVRITAEVADGLMYAHANGLVHRDIKPENILMSSGHAVIADFGLARALDEATEQRLTRSGFVAGTAAYMSPEQWSGSEVDGRSDQYSLACMLYELLSGEPPFKSPSVQAMLARHLQAPPPSLRTVVPDVDAGVEAAFNRAMAKAPADRFDSVTDFAAALAGTIPSLAPRRVRAGPGSSDWQRFAIPVVFAIAALGAIAYVILGNRGSPGSGAGGATADGEVRLVVLPFEHLGPPETAYITDGITEKLTNSLADIPRLGVIARTSAMQYAGVAKAPLEIGAELGVQYMIEGSLRPGLSGADSGMVTIAAGLYRTSDGQRVANYPELSLPEDSIFQMIGVIALNVATTLDIDVAQPQRERLAAQPTRDMRAWDYNLRGDELYNRNWTRAVIDSAVKLYDMATTLDPQFALAYAKLARAHAWMNQLRYDLSPQRLELSRRAAQTALRLDSLLMDAHLGLGFYYYWGMDDYDAAIAAFTRARELRPSGTGANLALVAMANVQRRQGRFDDAISNYRRARELDPRSYIIWYNLGETLLFIRQYEDARTQLEQVTQLNRLFPEGYVQRARLALNWRGDASAAHAILLELGRQVPDSTWRLPVWNMLRVTDPAPDDVPQRLRPRGTAADTAGYHIVKANVYDGLGRMAAARTQFDSARAILERLAPTLEGQPSIHGLLGLTYAAAGQADAALREGQRAMEILPESDDAFDGPEWRINMARILAILGRTDSAAEMLRPALDDPSWISRQWVAVDPIWARYRTSAAFQALLADSTARVVAGR